MRRIFGEESDHIGPAEAAIPAGSPPAGEIPPIRQCPQGVGVETDENGRLANAQIEGFISHAGESATRFCGCQQKSVRNLAFTLPPLKSHGCSHILLAMTTAISDLTQPQTDAADLERRIRLCVKTILRNRREWSIAKMATALGVHENTLGAHLNGLSGGLTLAELTGIAAELHCSVLGILSAAQGNDVEGLLLSTHLHLVAANDAPKAQDSPRRPLLQLVKS